MAEAPAPFKPALHRLSARLLLCSPELPPHYTGHAAVLERMFRGINPADYCMLAFSTRPPKEEFSHGALPAKTLTRETTWGQMPVPDYPLAQVRSVRKTLTEAVRRAAILVDAVRAEGCGGILVTSSLTPDPLAALLAARQTDVPLIVYMLDNWRHLMGMHGSLMVALTRRLQSLILASAKATLVPNAGLAADLLRDHGRRSTVVGIPLPDPSLLDPIEPRPWPATAGSIRIVFTGQVYAAHFEAITRVLEALESPRLNSVELHLYTVQSDQFVRSQGFRGKLVVHPHLAPAAIREVQREADILLLPLGFESPYPDIVRTASPTKTGEYLASGRPILVYAPPDSYPATLARRFGLALVDTPDTGAVEEAIMRIAGDPIYREKTTAAARRAAAELHGPQATTERFVHVLNRALTPRTSAA